MLPVLAGGVATQSSVIALAVTDPFQQALSTQTDQRPWFLVAGNVGAGRRDDGDSLVVEHCCYL